MKCEQCGEEFDGMKWFKDHDGMGMWLGCPKCKAASHISLTKEYKWTPSPELIATMASRLYPCFAGIGSWKEACVASVQAAELIARLVQEGENG